MEDLLRASSLFDAQHFQEGEYAQRSGCPNVGQQLRDSFNVGHGSGPSAEQHLSAFEPGLGIIGVVPPGLGRHDHLKPIGEEPGRNELSGHVSVIEVRMGVDEPRQERDLTQVKVRPPGARRQFTPAPHRAYPLA